MHDGSLKAMVVYTATNGSSRSRAPPGADGTDHGTSAQCRWLALLSHVHGAPPPSCAGQPVWSKWVEPLELAVGAAPRGELPGESEKACGANHVRGT